MKDYNSLLPLNHCTALAGALVLAVDAATDAQFAKAMALVEDFAGGLTQGEIEQAKAHALRILGQVEA